MKEKQVTLTVTQLKKLYQAAYADGRVSKQVERHSTLGTVSDNTLSIALCKIFK